MFIYVVVFLAAVVTDLIPIIGPPVWIVMVFMVVRFDLNPWLVLAVGVPGSVLGRYGLSRYIATLFTKVIKPSKTDEIRFAGAKLNGSLWRIWPFVLFYSLLPLSTTALFSAAGVARIKPIQILPPFFVGKFISDAVMVFTARYALRNTANILYDGISWRQMITTVAGGLLMAAFLFLDWRILLEQRRLRFSFRIWK